MEEHLCEGEWDSTINLTTNDGFFEFTVDQATGDVTGWHVVSPFEQYRIWGTCTHPNGAGAVHSIDIWEPRNGGAYRFYGVIKKNASGKHKAKGRRRLIIASVSEQQRQILLSKQEGEILLAGDDWEADKTT